jgi:hypothetical protein
MRYNKECNSNKNKILVTEKGKLRETVGRKATGLIQKAKSYEL